MHSIGNDNVVATLTNDQLSPILDQDLPVSSAFLPVPTTSKDIPSFMEDLSQRFFKVSRWSGAVMVKIFLQFTKNILQTSKDFVLYLKTSRAFEIFARPVLHLKIVMKTLKRSNGNLKTV